MTNKALIAAILTIGLLIPIGLYHYATHGVQQISVAQTFNLLESNRADLRVVYLRHEQDEGLIDQLSVPTDQFLSLAPDDDIPESIKGKTVLLLCEAGISAAMQAKRFQQSAVHVLVPKGGTQKLLSQEFTTTKPGEYRELKSFRSSTVFDRCGVFIAGFVMKPIYMVLSFLVFLLIRRSRIRELNYLAAAMFAFWAGENFCFFNYVFFNEESYLIELLHMYGMVACFGFLVLWLYQLIHGKLIRSADNGKTCLLVPLCRCCTHESGDCKAEKFTPVIVICFLFLSFMPLTARTTGAAYSTTTISGTASACLHPIWLQIYEIRVLPWNAITLLLIALILYIARHKKSASSIQVFMSFGIGFFCFSIFRLGLLAIYRHNLFWFIFWEELTELLFMCFIIWYLWQFYRNVFRLRPTQPA